MGTLLQDLRFALRSLRRAPAFPLAAIATLALGIGATTAIFSTLNAVLLKPLPYPKSEDLYNIRTTLVDGRITTGMLSNGELSRLNVPGSPIVRAAGMQPTDLTLLHQDGTPQHVRVYGVTQGFFELFGLPMTLGGFTHDHFVPPAPPPPNAPPGPGVPPLVVISHRVWQDLYAGDPAVVGKPIRFAEVATTIAGVAPKDFDTPHGGDYWFAQRLNPDARIEQGIGVLEYRTGEKAAAVATFRRLTKREPRNAELWALLARVAKGYDAPLSAAATARARALSPPMRP